MIKATVMTLVKSFEFEKVGEGPQYLESQEFHPCAAGVGGKAMNATVLVRSITSK